MEQNEHVNADRHLCQNCIYRGKTGPDHTCDYILFMFRSRGCNAENCDKYEYGKKRMEFEFSGSKMKKRNISHKEKGAARWTAAPGGEYEEE